MEEVCANSRACIWTELGQVPHLWLGDRLVSEPTLASWDGGCGGGGGGGGGAGRVGIRKVSRFDKGGQDSQVSESEPLSAPLPNALSFFSPCRLLPRHFPYNLSLNGTTKMCQSSSQAHNEWIHSLFCFDWGFYFFYFLQTFIRALTNYPVAQRHFWVLFTTSAAVIQSDSQTFFHSWKCQVIIGTLGGEIQC